MRARLRLFLFGVIAGAWLATVLLVIDASSRGP